MTSLPGTCASLLSLGSVDTALGRAVNGATSFVLGVPETDIGRLGYLNCRYGLPARAAGSAPPAVEIGVSLYRTAALAAKRIPETVDDYVAHGASSAAVTIGAGVPATVLTGGSGPDYRAPTLVAASGQRTVAVSVTGHPSTARKDLVALATLALSQTGG